jgi:hypothetical protein
LGGDEWLIICVERKFYLNLAGESAILDKAYIETMKDKSGMEFETILDCVTLPYWNQLCHRSSHGRQSAEPVEESNNRADMEVDPYRAIFDWLWESNVRKILSVEVDDSESEPHTNAGIRKAFRGEMTETDWARDFKVEVWKWKKFDLCSDTIAVSAPSVREVHLFSHGNTAVLKGWASKSGLAKLEQVALRTISSLTQIPITHPDRQLIHMSLLSSRSWWSRSTQE